MARTTDPERAALAKAIDEARSARAAVDAAKKAGERAQEQRWLVEDRLEVLRAAKAKAAASPKGIAAFIDSVAAGSSNDADVLRQPANADTADGDALEREIAAWQRTQDGCSAEVREREEARSRANERLNGAVRAVVCASGVAPRLIAEATRLRAELARVNEALSFIACNGMVPDAHRREAGIWKYLLDGAPQVGAAWKSAVAALASDAAAPLPPT